MNRIQIKEYLKAPNIALFKDFLQIVAILGAAAWAIYTLIEKNTREDYTYRGKAIAMASTCKIDLLGEESDSYMLKVQLKVASVSKLRIIVFDSPYQLVGVINRTIPAATPLKDLFHLANEQYLSGNPFIVSGRPFVQDGIPLEFGRLWKSASTLEPNETDEDVLITKVGKKTFQTFDAIYFNIKFVQAEDVARLGSEVRVEGNGSLKVNFLIYERPKSNYFSLNDTGKIKARIPETDILNPNNSDLLKDSNVAIGGTTCNISSAVVRSFVKEHN